MKTEGTVASWNDERGFGFIQPATGGEKVFLHIKAWREQGVRPAQGQLVLFESGKDKQGRLHARVAEPLATIAYHSASAPPAPAAKSKVVKRKPRVREGRGRSSLVSAIVILLLFFGSVAVAVMLGKLPLWILPAYLVLAVVTWLVYAADKAAARADRWRTSENTLHLLSLLGGWPGALLARRQLRHKSRKQPFRTIFWVTVVLNCVAFGWTLSDHGQHTLEQWLDPLNQWLDRLSQMVESPSSDRNYIRWSRPD